LVYAFSHEPRAFQPAQVGALLCLAVIAALVADYLAGTKISPRVVLVGRLTRGLAVVGLLTILLPASHARFEDAKHRYGAINQNAVQAMAWLRNSTEPGSVILPGNKDGWANYAWWVEGLGQRPAYALINPRFLAFKQELAQAAIARKLIDDSTS